jgi:sugar fermentation stimulation protein A
MLAFDTPLVEARFRSRYQRFFAEVELLSGEIVTAHCANTGRMTGLLLPGHRVRIRQQPPGRKLSHAWELVETDSGLACINTARANPLVAATDLGLWLPGTTFVRREPRMGAHRFDLELSRNGAPVYVEIKSVTLCEENIGYFPDAPSARAVAHIQLLAELAHEGIETHVIFVAMHAGILAVRPASKIDPIFATACVDAQAAGVRFSALSVTLTLNALSIQGLIPCEI